MTRTLRAALLSAGLLLAIDASAQTTITFDASLPERPSARSTRGVVFSANAFSGGGSSSSGSDWATNTDMTIVSIDAGTLGVEYGALGNPSLVSHDILGHFPNWEIKEDGDPSLLISLGAPASSVSVTFAGVGGKTLAPDTRIFAYAGSSLLGMAADSLPSDDVGR